MTYQAGKNTLLGLTAWVGYRLTSMVTEVVFDTVGGTVVATALSFAFNPYVNWALFFLAVYLALNDVPSITRNRPTDSLILAGGATAYAIVWHAMYFRFTGPLPPTVEQSGLRMALVTLTCLSIIYVSSPDRNLSRTGTLTAGTFVLGLIGAILTGLSPLPEILILAGALWTVSTSSNLSSRTGNPIETVDVEDRLLRGIVNAVRNEKGRYALLLVATGLAASLIFAAAIIGMFYINYGGNRPPIGWGSFFVVALPFIIYAAYGVWFWLRVLRRFPRFLSNRGGIPQRTTTTRPVGLLIPSSILSGSLGILQSNLLLALTGIVCGVLAILWSVATTSDSAPQSPETDQYAIPVALVVQLVPFVPFGFPNAMIPILILPSIYFLPEIRNRVSNTATLGITLGLSAVLIAFLWPLTVNKLLRLLVLPAEIALITAFLGSVSK